MNNYKRADRVADLIRGEISDIFTRRLRDPRIGTITITDVRVSDDLKVARIYYVLMGLDECSPEAKEGLKKANGFLRRELGKRLQLRVVPELIFSYDDSLIHGSRIERLLAEAQAQAQAQGENDAE